MPGTRQPKDAAMKREFTDDDRSDEAMLHREYVRQVQRMAEHLHRYADRIAVTGANVVTRQGQSRYLMAVADMLSEINAMHGNAPTWGLLAAAADAQSAFDSAVSP